MAAAVEAAERGAQATVLERMDRVGKKLLATGNGRCNLMNRGEGCYPGGEDFARQVLSRCGAKEQEAFWQRLGLRLREEDGGRVYPVSGQASTVLDALRLGMERAGVQVETGVQAEGIRREKGGFTVLAGEKRWHAERVILAGGGCAQPKLGSDGSLWALAEGLGHHLHRPRPALTQIVTDTAPIRGLSGIRVKAEVTALRGGRETHREAGEVLFADYGVSGVCVMNTARHVDKGGTLLLNLLPGMAFAGEGEARDELWRRRNAWAQQPMEALLTGLCVPRLASALCRQAGIQWKERLIGSLSRQEAEQLAKALGAFPLRVQGVKGFDMAQVTAGGLDTAEFDPATMGSRLVPGLYAAGEMLDVDGACGGFNLMFAFGSGMLAGRCAAETGGNV